MRKSYFLSILFCAILAIVGLIGYNAYTSKDNEKNNHNLQQINATSEIKISNTHVTPERIQLDDRDYVKLPVIMYHHISENQAKLNDWVITPNQLENDLKYLYNNGYSTVTYKQLSNYVNEGIKLPEKCVLLTFDDGYRSNYVYASPLLKKYDMRAIISVIGNQVDLFTDKPDTNVNYAYCNWDEVKQLSDEGYFEIGNHTYDHHISNHRTNYGISKKKYDTVVGHRERVIGDLTFLQNKFKENLGYSTEIFAYPFGYYDKYSKQIIEDLGFKLTFICEEGINKVEKGNPKSLLNLKRYNRSTIYSTESFMNKIAKS